jgi:hypothetical protein
MALFAEFFGGKPTTPDFVPVDTQLEQGKAIAGNIAASGQAQQLASQTNTFNQAELQKMLGSIPNFYNLVNKSGAKIQDLLAGNIPDDVVKAIKRGTAASSLYGGYGGSGMAKNLTARDLGLTSLQLINQGLAASDRWTTSARQNLVAPQFDVSSMFVTPQQQIAHATEERNAKFQRDYVKNQWDWYDSFGQKAVRFEDSLMQLAGDIAGAAGATCWVAREVFGESNPQWLQFREWMLNQSPKWFRNFYLKYGERFAAWIHDKPLLKVIIRRWMEYIISKQEVQHGLV